MNTYCRENAKPMSELRGPLILTRQTLTVAGTSSYTQYNIYIIYFAKHECQHDTHMQFKLQNYKKMIMINLYVAWNYLSIRKLKWYSNKLGHLRQKP